MLTRRELLKAAVCAAVVGPPAQRVDVEQLVRGMSITTVQWEAVGGMQLHFKVMASLVPRLTTIAEYNKHPHKGLSYGGHGK